MRVRNYQIPRDPPKGGTILEDSLSCPNLDEILNPKPFKLVKPKPLYQP